MSNNNFFDQQDEGEFRDMPEEVGGQSAPNVEVPIPPTPRRQGPPPVPMYAQQSTYAEQGSEFEDIDMNIDSDDDDYSQVLNDAGLRLEQGNLYKMIMNHDIFDGVDADPLAIKSVTKQIRKFAKEQMEIMLGMRRETAKIERLEIEFPFNQVEVDVLRKLAFTASKGASAQSDNFVPEVKRVSEDVPVVNSPRREGLNRINVAPKQMQRPAPAQERRVARPVAPQTQLPNRPSSPLQRKALPPATQQILSEEGLTQEEIDRQFEPQHKPLQKPLHELTAQELLERNRETSARRHQTVKNPSAMPMPTYEMESMVHTQRIMESAGNGAVHTIMAAINNQAQKK